MKPRATSRTSFLCAMALAAINCGGVTPPPTEEQSLERATQALVLPTWRFTVKVGVLKATADRVGQSVIQQRVLEQFERINLKFNAPGVFKARLDFAVTELYVFDGDSAVERDKPHPSHDYLVIYDDTGGGGGWYGGSQSIWHRWPSTSDSGIFGPNGTDAITHEFAHARGAVDLYALNVDGCQNPVDNSGYAADYSRMHQTYGVDVWDRHTVHIINNNAATANPARQYITQAFPASMGVVVRNQSGTALPNAQVSLHPVPWFQNRVDLAPVMTGSTDGSGVFVFPSNPFGPDELGSPPWWMTYPSFLIKAVSGSEVGFAYMPLTEVQSHHFDLPGAAYRLSLSTRSRSALLVVGSPTLAPGDAALRARLQARGYTVTVQDDDTSATSQATGKSLVLISASVTSTKVNAKYRDVAVPVLTLESFLFDDMKMTGTTSGVDFGEDTTQSLLTILSPAHTTAAGIDGVRNVLLTGGNNFLWGRPAATAAKVAHVPDNADKALIFGYTSGTAMVGLNAPARRAGWFASEAAAANLNCDGQRLFDAAVAWSTGTDSLPVIGVSPAAASTSEVPASAPAAFTVFRTGNYNASVAIQYSVSGSATAGADYPALSGSVTLPAGWQQIRIEVPALADAIAEGDETVRLTLTPHASYALAPAAFRMATVTIADDDSSGPIAAWAFDEGSGTSAFDGSGNGHSATLVNGPLWTSGQSGGALNLDGSNDYVQSNASGILNTATSFTVAAWVSTASTSGVLRAAVSQDGASISPFKLELNSNNQWSFTLRSADSTTNTTVRAQSGTVAAINTWYHLVGVCDVPARLIRLYVNGALKSTTSFTFTPWDATGRSLIGRARWAGLADTHFHGKLDQARLYQRVLGATEIANLHQSGQ